MLMKKCILIFLSVFIFFSCSSNRHYCQLTNGKWISKKEYDKIKKECFDIAWANMTDEEKEFSMDTTYRFNLIVDDSSGIVPKNQE